MVNFARGAMARQFGRPMARMYSEVAKDATKDLRQKREEHLEQLKKYYPPSLIKSILAAEAAVTPEMWANRKAPARAFAPNYADDYAEYDPLYDHARGEWVDKTKPRQPIPQRVLPGSQVPPDIMSSRAPSATNLTQLEQLTGLKAEYLRKLVCKPLIRKRVVNMTRLGKRPSYYALAVVGDMNGHVGIGEGRDSKLATKAVAHAHWEAVKNLRYIPRFEDRTIYGDITHKRGAVVINLRSSAPGSGLRVNHIIYEICKVAGIKDLVGNVYRSRNPMNVAKTALEALSTKQVLIDEIAADRGKRVVDVTNTYLNF
ncbi:37S ribosomal protein S5, mitochondrial [Wickerhamiella sorbophila]|uniref:Small ribosomal subunit protein uS5m n=1 Tax=Wickerhamiella sorbophila TaxID=45607 RepID=A0A2T0FF16_9ASCO|nr:37S ribosomal protein S5, mitochondrial [Wickerhamiella sorbophila]PRT53557.1 37S ribosomal protein S5, mitochondrial [Wickerhamiella sorbophila]